MDSISVNRNPNSDNQLVIKNYLDNDLDKNTILRYNQTLESYLKVSVGNIKYKLTNNNKIQLTDKTVMRAGNTRGYLLLFWKNVCNDKNNRGKITNFKKPTKTKSPTGDSGANSSPPIGSSYLYMEISSNDHGNNVFVSFERTDIIQITNITFYYNRFSISTNDNSK